MLDWLGPGYYGQTVGGIGKASCYCMFIFGFDIIVHILGA